MVSQAAKPEPEPEPQRHGLPPPSLANEEECKIRWERQSDDKQQLVILDAVTGRIIAVVRSLFEIGPH
jgi:hypothetical protein